MKEKIKLYAFICLIFIAFIPLSCIQCSTQQSKKPDTAEYLIVALNNNVFIDSTSTKDLIVTDSGYFQAQSYFFKYVYNGLEKYDYKWQKKVDTANTTYLLKINQIFEKNGYKNIELKPVFNSKEVQKLYSSVSSSISTVCIETNFTNVLGVELCYHDTQSRDRLISDLREISSYAYSVKSDSFTPTACQNVSSISPKPYQTEMGIDNLWSNSNVDMGSKGKFTIIESGNKPDKRHCEFNGLFIDSKIENLSSKAFSCKNGDHATESLGVLIAKHDKKASATSDDCFGIVPKAQINKLICFSASFSCNTYSDGSAHTATSDTRAWNAVLEGINASADGDIILLEFQVGTELPAETDPIIFDLIKIATNCKNVIVVEPAGNGIGTGQDIDAAIGRISGEVRDSGAIIVGATEDNIASNGTRIKKIHTTSNRGTRIDCYAKGDGILSTGISNAYQEYHQTSAASAIIAGVVLGIQSNYRKLNSGRSMTPTEMRIKLRDCTQKIDVFDNDLTTIIGKVPKVSGLI